MASPGPISSGQAIAQAKCRAHYHRELGVKALMRVLLSAPYLPFSLALGLLFGLLALELLALLLGASFFADHDAVPDGAVDTHFDFQPDAEVDVAALVAASHATDGPAAAQPLGGGTALSILGLGRVPFALWFAALLLGFGLAGTALQSLAQAATGSALPGWLAALPAGIAGLFTAKRFSAVMGSLVLQNETTATGPQFLGGLHGLVTQGVARRGSPAEVRLRDRHGNTHYQRCEPFRDTDVIAEGTEVLTLRERKDGGGWCLRIVAIPS